MACAGNCCRAGRGVVVGAAVSELEIVELCAKAIGASESTVHPDGILKYWPLTDDAQMAALMKKFKLKISWHYAENVVRAIYAKATPEIRSQYQSDLNYAVCQCVANIQDRK